jgi:hypothetical protein
MLLALALAGCTLAAAGPVRPFGMHAFDDRLSPSPEPHIFPDSPAGYTQAAVTAWASRDSAQFKHFVQNPFDADHGLLPPGYDTHFRLQEGDGCGCEYINRDGDTVYFLLIPERLGYPHAIRIVSFTTATNNFFLHNGMASYTGNVMFDWVRVDTPGDTPEASDIYEANVALATTPEAKKQLDALASHRRDNWTYAGVREAAGASYLTWRNDEGDRLVFRYDDPLSAPSRPHWIAAVLWNP